MSRKDEEPAGSNATPPGRDQRGGADAGAAADRLVPRSEQAVFDDLSRLCSSPGFVHSLAYCSYRDNVIGLLDELTADSVRQLYSPKRLLKTELATLHGLMVKAPVDYTLPTPETLERYVEESESLMKELHGALIHQAYGSFDFGTGDPSRGAVIREAAFYSGESAYIFQYRDLAAVKYGEDDEWIRRNKGFSIGDARAVLKAVTEVQERNLLAHLSGLRGTPPAEWSMLGGFTFTVGQISALSGIDEQLTERVLVAFALPDQERNIQFRALDDYNSVTAFPLLRRDATTFVLLQIYSLAEALYDTPFYWMTLDATYLDAAMKNRGEYTERFAADRLERVFGRARVHKNVRMFRGHDEIGEIDVLVVFGDRAIVLQAKSKRLTLAARKGNDQQITNDFKKSVEDSYEQAVKCSEALLDRSVRLVDDHGASPTLPGEISEIYPVCLVADHYPALAFQVSAFLKTMTIDKVTAPLVLDVFALDVITELLSSPLRFLAYIRQRVLYAGRISATHEISILAYHLRHNLWLSDQYDLVRLEDDFGDDVDVAMSVRRDGVPGCDTPPGILTKLAGTTVGDWVTEIEQSSDPGTIRLGLLLLTLSEECVRDISDSLNQIATRALDEEKHQDLTIALGDTGLTIHCNERPIEEAMRGLHRHCTLRKYSMEASSWHGVCIDPGTKQLRLGATLEYPWVFDAQLEERRLPKEGARSLREIHDLKKSRSEE